MKRDGLNRCRTELLAPAGEAASAWAAFAEGADAVYAGLPRFSARADAVNLSVRELEAVAAYAHGLERPRKVYVTVNTLVRDGELDEAARALEACEACGADAVIVQDLGVAALARERFPRLRLHASTQLAIHNAAGARAAAELGFKRVTLARELGMEEIREIAAAGAGEVEVFVHGALCYSYSGLCLYSALLRGRSGNRGACAYPCRDCFAAAGAEGGLVFSMKDLARGEWVGRLAAAGVASLKIEGRKKSPLYVAAATRYYRKWLDGSFADGEREELERDLKTIFARPWTDMMKGRRDGGEVVDPETTGHRGVRLGTVAAATRRFVQFRTEAPLEVHDGIQVEPAGERRPFGFGVEGITLSDGREVWEAPAGAMVEVPLPPGAPRLERGETLFAGSSQAVKRKYRHVAPNEAEWRRRLAARVRVERVEAGLAWRAEADGEELGRVAAEGVLGGPFGEAKNPEGMRRALEEAAGKLGDTRFRLEGVEVAGVLPFVPVSRLNAWRREWAGALEARLEEARAGRAAKTASWLEGLREAGEGGGAEAWDGRVLLKTDQPGTLSEALGGMEALRVGETTVEWSPDLREEDVEALRGALPPGTVVRLGLPPVTRAWEREALEAWMARAWERGQRAWEIANLDGLERLRKITGRGARELDVTADWWVWAWNRASVASLLAAGVRRVGCSPEDTAENVAAVAERYPWRMTWGVLRDPPLFLSEHCPEAARRGGCPGPAACGYRGEELASDKGEGIVVASRGCRTAALMAKPQFHPVPPGVKVVGRAEFCRRAWTAEGMRHSLFHVI